mgnify:CR=1 FL=1
MKDDKEYNYMLFTIYVALWVYPNPVVDGEIIITSPINGIKWVTIFDMQGQKVYSKQISPDETVNVSNLSSGVYIIEVLENEILEKQRLIIK